MMARLQQLYLERWTTILSNCVCAIVDTEASFHIALTARTHVVVTANVFEKPFKYV